MRYVSIDGPLKVSIQERVLAEPEANEILVKTTLSGISVGTELAVFRGTINTLHSKRWGYWSEFPISPGYELVGRVENCGAGIEDVREGDRVVCHAPHGTQGLVAYQDYVPVPEEVTDEEATLAMLGATTAHGIRKAEVRYGDRVLVLGLGVVGFLSAAHARRSGARQVYVADPLPWKRSFAEHRGYHSVLDPISPTFEQEILEQTRGRGMDLVIEASGNSTAIPAALKAVRRGGTILLQGTQTEPVEMQFSDYPMHKEVRIICTWGKGPEYYVDIPERIWSRKQNQELAMELIARGELPVSDLVTHRFQFEEILRVYEMIHRDEIEYLQVVLNYE
jgi:2-desacetyl-2-hydroxyethyl bacteriochlorophyllide A dehydrogenase